MNETHSPRRLRVVAITSIGTLWILSAAIVSSWIHSPSIDEAAHLAAGLTHWDIARFELYGVNPHLPRLVYTAPTRLFDYEFPHDGYRATVAERGEFAAGRRLFQMNQHRTLALLRSSRLLAVLMVLPTTLWAVLWITSELKHIEVAMISTVLLVCISPTMLTHGSMVTPDFASMLALIVWVGLLRQWLRFRTLSSAFSVGLMGGIAICCKFTLLVVCPAILLAMLPVWKPCQSVANGVTRRTIFHICLIGVLALVVVNSVYAWQGCMKPLGTIQFVSTAFRNSFSCGEVGGSHMAAIPVSLLASLPCPFPECYVQGVDAQAYDFEVGFRSYLMGEWKHGGWWYYYLIGFLVKEPMGFQLMLYVSVLHGLWNWKRWTRNSIREWSLIVTPPLLIFGLVSSQTGFNHHMRYLLAAYPFLFIIAARTVTLGKFWKWFSYSCLIWQAAAVLCFAPHWMSYFNEFAGGPKNGHKWLVDSNIDWGQDILMLKWWQDKHPESAPLNAALFTGFDPKDIGLKFKLPAPFVKGQSRIISHGGLRGPQPGWYAVSVCMLKGLHCNNVPKGDGEWTWSTENFTYFLDNFEPVDMIGYSIYIYHISDDDAARVRAKLLAEEAEFLNANGGEAAK